LLPSFSYLELVLHYAEMLKNLPEEELMLTNPRVAGVIEL